MPEYETYSCEEVGKAWQKLRKRIQNGRKLKWTGPDRLHYRIAAGSPPPSHYLTKKNREHDREQGRDIWDMLFLIAFQIGFHNGIVTEENSGTNFYKRMYDSDQTLIDHLLKRPTLEQFDDALCNALVAARQGEYDSLTVEDHLEMLIERVRENTSTTKDESNGLHN